MEATMSSEIRTKRLEGTIRKYLGAELARDIADPRLAAVYIHDVSVTNDLSLATVTVRLLVGGEQEAERKAVLGVLTRIAPRLRSVLAPQLRMRRVPDLRFRYDVGTDHAHRIAEVLREIHEEDAKRQAARDSDSDVKGDKGDE
jgi:ribosome-binding factor A